MSRWITPVSCAKAIAQAMSREARMMRSSLSAGSASSTASSEALSSGIANHTCSPSCPTSRIRMMLGCRICPATSASYRNRAVNCLSPAYLGLRP